MAEIILNLDELEIDCPEVFGIACNLRFHRLAWQLQQLVEFQIYREEDVPNEAAGGSHACYKLLHLDEQTEYLLVKNKGERSYFYKKYRDLDFLLFGISGRSSSDNEILMSLKDLNCVSLCLKLDKPVSPESVNFIQFQ